MNMTAENYIYLLSCAIRRTDPLEALRADPERLEALKQTDWKELYQLALQGKTFSLLSEVIARCGELVNADREMLAHWRHYARRMFFNQLEVTRSIHAIAHETEKRGIPVVFFKGPVIADLYPHYAMRNSCDTDIWVSDEQKEAAMRMLEEMGYRLVRESSKEHVQVYHQESPSSYIELHTRLWEDYNGKRIQALEAMNLTAPENLVVENACGARLTTLEPRRHLVYQIFHIVKHFMLEGISVRYLLDITLFIQHYRDRIDFEQFWADMERLEYTVLCQHLFSICVRDYGLDERVLCGKRAMMDGDTERLLIDILGRDGHWEKTAKWQIMGTMIPYFVGEKEMRKSRIGRKIDAIFLRPKDLTKEYAYARRVPILLPVAWIHRAVRYLLDYFANRKILYNASEKLDVTEYRLYLMNRMGLVNEKE